MPASRSARAMIFAPRSCPSSPGLAMTTRIFRAIAGEYTSGRAEPTSGVVAAVPARRPPGTRVVPAEQTERKTDDQQDEDADGNQDEALRKALARRRGDGGLRGRRALRLRRRPEPRRNPVVAQPSVRPGMGVAGDPDVERLTRHVRRVLREDRHLQVDEILARPVERVLDLL